ncbi:hypothetical protein [Hymenobacter properus]|uniref:Uncharacterized protein n=1 Tax=Hymenobacter properus TaxID=2791026 RepID=A0A931FKB4_9BACT|nr:hypothetical protein [Hymenobacter properus]MBF9140821.1 hypothetical protein [Hymenobacter properus]MBR7719630.1 hypothetical protein [Microvirga sp. SRT04]
MAKVTLSDEIASLQRELVMRQRVYPNLRQNAKTVREREEMRTTHEHEIACTQATLARLQAMVPQQAELFQ